MHTNDQLFFLLTRVLFGLLIFFPKSCLKVGGVAYTQVQLIHESLCQQNPCLHFYHISQASGKILDTVDKMHLQYGLWILAFEKEKEVQKQNFKHPSHFWPVLLTLACYISFSSFPAPFHFRRLSHGLHLTFLQASYDTIGALKCKKGVYN